MLPAKIDERTLSLLIMAMWVDLIGLITAHIFQSEAVFNVFLLILTLIAISLTVFRPR